MPLPEACRRPGRVHFPEEDGRTLAFASETASLSLLSGRWTAQTLLATVVDDKTVFHYRLHHSVKSTLVNYYMV